MSQHQWKVTRSADFMSGLKTYGCAKCGKTRPSKTEPPKSGCAKRKAKAVLHHDDPPCNERLDSSNYCLACRLYPDTQSVCIYFYCPKCDCKLKKMKCPQCKKVFVNPIS